MKINTSLLGAALALSMTFGFAANSSASQVTISQVSGYSSGSGGEFLLVPSSDLSYLLNGYAATAKYGSGFLSFCIEKNEYFSPGSTYNAAISNGAIGGGVSGAVGGTDIISKGTAWLYKNFATGFLSGYDYNPVGGRSTAGELQNAIWYLEGELSSIGANQFITQVTTQFGTLANAVLDNDGSYGVKAVNLGKASSFPNQDQLVYIPTVADGGMTVALLGLGMLGVFLIRRQLKSA